LLSERVARNGVVSDSLWNQLTSLANDPAIRVRYQLTFTMGAIGRPNRVAVLGTILSRDFANPWIHNAVLSSLGDNAGAMFVLLTGDGRFRNDPGGLEFLRRLATMIGAQGHADDVAQVIDFITRDQLNPFQAFALLYALGDGLHQTKSSLALVDPQSRLQRWYTAALNTSLGLAPLDPTRVEAIHLLGFSPYKYSDLSDWLLTMCNPPPIPAIQNAAIDTLCRFDDPQVLPALLDYWQGLTAAVRNHALTELFSKDARVPAVLHALAAGRIYLADCSPWQLNFLRTYRDPAISARAVQLLGPVKVRRPDAETRFRPALQLSGSAERGRALFRARCADCHRFGSEGQWFGPDLTAARAGGKEKILSSILEPSLSVVPAYSTWIVETKEGENLVGIKADDDLATITLRQPGGVQLVWPRLNVRSAQNPDWSLMPDGLEEGFSLQDMADLLQYLMTGPK
jgi:putative heme-binding domain-containing protein